MSKRDLEGFERAFSHLDDITASPKPLWLKGKPLSEGQFGHTVHPVIFPSGLVMLAPRWTAARYQEFYEKEYDSLYRLDLKPDVGVAGIEKNAREIRDRLVASGLSKQNISTILDLGAGPGFGIPVLKDYFESSNVSVIEGSPAARKIIRENNFAEVIGNFVDEKIVVDNLNSFDLVIMRHVVEHFLSPLEELRMVASLLSDNGWVYIAVPDMLTPRTILRDYEFWWEYWFRSVHAYYYNHFTLFRTLWLSGLVVEEWGRENEEIWCVARKVRSADSEYLYDESAVYQEQMDVLRRLLS